MTQSTTLAKPPKDPAPLGLLRDRLARVKYARTAFRILRRTRRRSVLRTLLATLRIVFWPRRTILFYPQRPSRKSVDFHLCALLGYATTRDPRRRFDAAFKRLTENRFDPAVLDAVPLPPERIINARSLDITKTHVARIFADVFGYPLQVDPTRHQGPVLEKSDANGMHDGRVLQGPLSPEQLRPGRVYQKLVNNLCDKPGYVLDYRVIIHGDRIPVLYLKYRPVEVRCAHYHPICSLAEPDEGFSPEELQSLLAFARRMGLDYCELDVLRDVHDGRIYVVDANNTPFGPPHGFSEADRAAALERIKLTFDQLLHQYMR
jgi:hypothetical protein